MTFDRSASIRERGARSLLPVPVAMAALGALLIVAGVLLSEPAMAQTTDQARQMRHFWHVFAAYAIAWILLFGWVVSILKRLRRVEERLGGGE